MGKLWDFCKVNVKYGNWTNDGSCQPLRAEIECGKKSLGIQHQSRSCADGKYDKCLNSKTKRNVSCEINPKSFSQCQGQFEQKLFSYFGLENNVMKIKKNKLNLIFDFRINE